MSVSIVRINFFSHFEKYEELSNNYVYKRNIEMEEIVDYISYYCSKHNRK